MNSSTAQLAGRTARPELSSKKSILFAMSRAPLFLLLLPLLGLESDSDDILTPRGLGISKSACWCCVHGGRRLLAGSLGYHKLVLMKMMMMMISCFAQSSMLTWQGGQGQVNAAQHGTDTHLDRDKDPETDEVLLATR